MLHLDLIELRGCKESIFKWFISFASQCLIMALFCLYLDCARFVKNRELRIVCNFFNCIQRLLFVMCVIFGVLVCPFQKSFFEVSGLQRKLCSKGVASSGSVYTMFIKSFDKKRQFLQETPLTTKGVQLFRFLNRGNLL